MIRRLRTAICCRKGRLPLFAILVALWAANGSPGLGNRDHAAMPNPPQARALTALPNR